MTPSLFSNDHSRGPLYQYWKERSDEESSLRRDRMADAQLRSRGQQPISPTPGPSSASSYADRAPRGPPTYHHTCTSIGTSGETAETSPFSSPTTTNSFTGRNVHTSMGTDMNPDTLPPYYLAVMRNDDAIPLNTSGGRTQNQDSNTTTTLPITPQEEKSHLARIEQQDTITTSTTTTFAESQDNDHYHDQPKRRKKSIVGKVGGWLADAASGYTKKQERW